MSRPKNGREMLKHQLFVIKDCWAFLLYLAKGADVRT